MEEIRQRAAADIGAQPQRSPQALSFNSATVAEVEEGLIVSQDQRLDGLWEWTEDGGLRFREVLDVNDLIMVVHILGASGLYGQSSDSHGYKRYHSAVAD